MTCTEEYEKWFDENRITFESELLAIRQLLPQGRKGIEIGIGTGIFAAELGIKYGIDPSENMLKLARERHLNVTRGFAENLPYPAESFYFAAFITSLCFIDDPGRAMEEAHRILKDEGEIIIAFIDRDSQLGQTLLRLKEENKFYRIARFYSVPEVIDIIEKHGFIVSGIVQTLTGPEAAVPEQPSEGYGKGGFVVIKARKK